MRKILAILIYGFCLLINPTNINAESLTTAINSPAIEQPTQPTKTYYLSVLGRARTEIAIDPPATKIVVTSQSGDTIIRCGDEQNAYSCSPGKRLELNYEITAPAVSFWGENMTDNQVRLQIDAYQIIPTDEERQNSNELLEN